MRKNTTIMGLLLTLSTAAMWGCYDRHYHQGRHNRYAHRGHHGKGHDHDDDGSTTKSVAWSYKV